MSLAAADTSGNCVLDMDETATAAGGMLIGLPAMAALAGRT